MSKKLKSLVAVASIAALLAAVPSASMHFALSRSTPAAGESVEAPSMITLWFTQVPQENSISIRLVDGRGELVASTDPRQAADDGTEFSVRPSAALAPGGYTVAWRGIGEDGHTVRGDFGFTVRAR